MLKSLREREETTQAIVRRVGEMLRTGRERLGRIDFKSATDMVTDLDRRAETMVVDALRTAFPGDGILAEEGSHHQGDTGLVWIVDPLDGTTNYVHGHPFYAVSVACVDADGPLVGVVDAPQLAEMYTAIRGGGARVLRGPGTEVHTLGPRRAIGLGSALLATGFPYVRDAICRRNCRLTEEFLLHPCHGVRRGGSAALDLSFVAVGRLDGYWEFSLRPWDVAAGALIAAEAGATVSDATGGDDWRDGRHIVAAAPELHAAMLAVIGPVLADAAPMRGEAIP